jgi:uncharacterized protein YdaU (DUF1376 family)
LYEQVTDTRIAARPNMSKPHSWMPLWIGDFLADTLTMNNAEIGSYMLLMMAYWRNGGPLRDDDAELCRISRANGGWPAIRTKLLQGFFRARDGFWHQKRLDAELRKAGEVYEQRSRGARNRWSATTRQPDKLNKESSMDSIQESSMDSSLQSQSQSQSQLPSHSDPQSLSSRENASSTRRFTKPSEEEVKLHAAKIGLPHIEAQKFFHFYQSKGWRVGAQPMKSWHSAMETWRTRWQSDRVPEASERREHIEAKLL